MAETITLLGHENVTVREKISYKERVEAATEMIARGGVFDEERGAAYMSYLEMPVTQYVMLKMHTDMPMDDYDGVDGLYKLMDDLENDEDARRVMEGFIDAADIDDIKWRLFDETKKSFEAEHSLAHKIGVAFAFLFDGKDITQTMAEAREVNEQMIDHLGKISQIDAGAKLVDVTQFAKKAKE